MQADPRRARGHPAASRCSRCPTRTTATAAIVARRRRRGVVRPAALLGRASARRSCAIPRTSRASSMLTTRDPAAHAASTARSSTSRSATALLGGLLYGRPGAALFSLLLVGVYFWVARRARTSTRSPTRSRPTSACPRSILVAAAAGAAARRLLDRQAEAEAELAAQERRLAGGGRARAARARHARLARQDRVGDRLRGARALAPDRARPARARRSRRAGSPRTRARRRARRARSSSGCARTPASRCRSRSRSPR